MSTTTTTTADVLRRAKALLIEKGWTRGSNYDPATGCFCAVGAIRTASADYRSGTAAILATRDAIGWDGPLYEWNDAQDSVGPVLAAFDSAIARAAVTR